MTEPLDPIAGNLAKLREQFPEAFPGGRLDFGVLRRLLGESSEGPDASYGLVWHGKCRAADLASRPAAGVLRPCPGEGLDEDRTRNLMIEGDCLEVLRHLQATHAERVQLIYLDPPYNSGKDYVYPDNFQDTIRNYRLLTGLDGTETAGRFHTDWLNLMYPCLKLARSLLRNDGFIFVSIDDAEVHNLRHLLNELFGEDNFVANLVWQKKYTRANDAQFFSANHDHILVFARNKEAAALAQQPRTRAQEAAYGNPDHHPKGPWKATPLHAKSGSNTAPYVFRNGRRWAPPAGTYRRFTDAAMARMDAAGELWFGRDQRSTPSRKTFLSEAKAGVTPVTIWLHDEVGHNHEANNELKELLGQGVFENPKPTRLLRRILELAAPRDGAAIVLDFFAGSGTTGHAVLARNAADGGDRSFILVQLPEPLDPAHKNQKAGAAFCDALGRPRTIAELTKERLRRAALKIRKEAPAFTGDLGFRVLRLEP